jgi:ribonuclease Z
MLGRTSQPWSRYVLSSQVIDIYGPEGLRHLLRAIIQISQSRLASPYRVHELKNIPTPINKRQTEIHTVHDSRYGEVKGESFLYPNSRGHYEIPMGDDSKLIVTAAPMVHSVPCVGYVIEEKNRLGALKTDIVLPLFEKNFVRIIRTAYKYFH